MKRAQCWDQILKKDKNFLKSAKNSEGTYL